jgi:hypothetical protein
LYPRYVGCIPHTQNTHSTTRTRTPQRRQRRVHPLTRRSHERRPNDGRVGMSRYYVIVVLRCSHLQHSHTNGSRYLTLIAVPPARIQASNGTFHPMHPCNPRSVNGSNLRSTDITGRRGLGYSRWIRAISPSPPNKAYLSFGKSFCGSLNTSGEQIKPNTRQRNRHVSHIRQEPVQLISRTTLSTM